MTKLANLICVEDINSSPAGSILTNLLTRIELENLPNNFTFQVAFSLVDIETIINSDDFIELTLIDPSLEVLMATGPVAIPSNGQDQEQVTDISANLNFRNVRFEKEGLYEIKLSTSLTNETLSTYFTVALKKA